MTDASCQPPRKPVKRPLSKAALAKLAKRPTKSQLRKVQKLRDDGVII